MSDHKFVSWAGNELGDKTIQWVKGNEEMEKAAEELWNVFIAEGYKAFYVKTRGPNKGQPSANEMKDFDASAESVIFVAKAQVGGG